MKRVEVVLEGWAHRELQFKVHGVRRIHQPPSMAVLSSGKKQPLPKSEANLKDQHTVNPQITPINADAFPLQRKINLCNPPMAEKFVDKKTGTTQKLRGAGKPQPLS
jgi:hypothetical protein